MNAQWVCFNVSHHCFPAQSVCKWLDVFNGALQLGPEWAGSPWWWVCDAGSEGCLKRRAAHLCIDRALGGVGGGWPLNIPSTPTLIKEEKKGAQLMEHWLLCPLHPHMWENVNVIKQNLYESYESFGFLYRRMFETLECRPYGAQLLFTVCELGTAKAELKAIKQDTDLCNKSIKKWGKFSTFSPQFGHLIIPTHPSSQLSFIIQRWRVKGNTCFLRDTSSQCRCDWQASRSMSFLPPRQHRQFCLLNWLLAMDGCGIIGIWYTPFLLLK